MKKQSGSFRINPATLSKVGLALAVVSPLGQGAYAGDTWTGTASQDWNEAANWAGAFPTGNASINTSTGNYPVISSDPTFTPVDIFVGTGLGNTGRLDQTAGTAATGNDNWFFVGSNSGSGDFNLANTATSGGTLTGFGEGSGSLTVGKFWVGGAAFNGTGTGTTNINTSGTLTMTTGGGVSISVGDNGTGTLNLDNGTVEASGELWTGAAAGANGTINQAAGTINTGGYFVTGLNGTGTFNMTGGTVNASSGYGFATLASFTGASGTMNISGGTFNVVSDHQLYIGEGGTGTVNLSGGGLITVSHATEGVRFGAAGGTGTMNLDGGTLQTPIVTKGTGSGTFNFNGGTLRAVASTATFLEGLTRANVRNGGALIDTGILNVAIGQDLLHSDIGGDNAIDGGLTKLGTGTLTLSGANAYNGPTTVNNGTLALSGSISSTTLGFNLTNSTAGQMSILNPAFSFSGTIALGLTSVTLSNSWTLFNGAAFDSGDFNSLSAVTSDLGAFANAGGGTWTLVNGSGSWSFDDNTGVLTVVAVPEPSSYVLIIGGLFALVIGFRRRYHAS